MYVGAVLPLYVIFDMRAYVREFSKNFSEGEKSIEKEGIGNFKCRFPNIQL